MAARAALLTIACLFFATSVRAAPAEWLCDRSPLLIKNVRLPGASNATHILISDGRIQNVGPDLTVPESNHRVIDGARAFALPGLIDSHTHFDALPAAKHRQANLNVQTEIFPVTMRQTLASGVTTARTHLAALADMPLMAALNDDDCFPSPRLVLSGPGLLGGAPRVNARLMRGIAGPEDATSKVQELAEHGAAWLALHGIESFSSEELESVFTAAEKNNIDVMADTDSFESLSAALKWPVLSGEYINRSPAAAYPPEILEAVSAKDDFYLTPPLGYYLRSVALAEDETASFDPALLEFTPDELAVEMKASFREAFDKDDYIASAVEAVPTFKEKFKALRAAGAKPVIGSDSGSLGQFHLDAVWKEMAAWRDMGEMPNDVLAGATTTPAEMLGRDDIGVLETGARGDVVLYNGGLNAGEFDRMHVVAVIKGGVVYVADGRWVGPDAQQTKAKVTAHIERVKTAGQ
ncbi:amidohydrolase family protein [Hyphococcus sp.]|uniref:amidohydrolase family protein n=1 Tax=Hyphococcus sp. TaxID=2038636 RepID=UPI003D10FF56